MKTLIVLGLTLLVSCGEGHAKPNKEVNKKLEMKCSNVTYKTIIGVLYRCVNSEVICYVTEYNEAIQCIPVTSNKEV